MQETFICITSDDHAVMFYYFSQLLVQINTIYTTSNPILKYNLFTDWVPISWGVHAMALYSWGVNFPIIVKLLASSTLNISYIVTIHFDVAIFVVLLLASHSRDPPCDRKQMLLNHHHADHKRPGPGQYNQSLSITRLFNASYPAHHKSSTCCPAYHLAP